jgi:methylated-DNA-[protein]-cysteine S-methyltransferase
MIRKFRDIWVGAALNKNIIGACGFSEDNQEIVLSSIIRSLPKRSAYKLVKNEIKILNILDSINQIYEGKTVEYTFNLEIDRYPPFTKKTLNKTLKIPKGFVTTYGRIARAAGNEKASRAVGAIEASNPFAPIVPCHRVVDSNLKLHGYGGGLDTKRRFLEREGVIFKGDRVAETCLWNP